MGRNQNYALNGSSAN